MNYAVTVIDEPIVTRRHCKKCTYYAAIYTDIRRCLAVAMTAIGVISLTDRA